MQAKTLLPSRSQRNGLEVEMLPIAPTRWWKAHKLGNGIPGRDAVINMQLIEHPYSLLCVSQNGTANVWDLEMTADQEKILLSAKKEAKLTQRERIARNRKESIQAMQKLNAGEEDEVEIIVPVDVNDVGNTPQPRMLGILDPDINRATPEWKFTLNIEERKRKNIVEAKRVLHEAKELLKKPKRKSWEEGNGNGSDGGGGGSTLGSPGGSPGGSPKSSPYGSPRASPLGSPLFTVAPPCSPLRVPNKHDYTGHDVVMVALDTAFVRPPSPSRQHNQGSMVEQREDFSSSNSAVTADMLLGRVGGDGGETMKWRKQAEEDKKHRRRPGSSSSSSSRASNLPRLGKQSRVRGGATHSGLRSRVLGQLAPKKYGFVPLHSPANPPKQWYEYSGSRSSVPKLRHLDPDKLTGFRNDGWDDDAISDNLSVIADDEDDLADFLTKKLHPCDSWVDAELSSYAADVHAERRQERRNPRNKTTGALKSAGVTETIVHMKRESRVNSRSVVGKMLRM